ncbi:UPF0014-domain-containing protein [Neoconidiobolus thromboides FSU 785]|nr:UPF0014-domain-containing protein [Neoconidiobolus thromboides FSU 785]
MPNNYTTPPSSEDEVLTWYNVLYSIGFILFPIILSFILNLGLSLELIIAGLRCILQLTLMGTVLDQVLGTTSPIIVIMLAFCLTCLASFELVYSKTRRQFSFMLPFVLLSLTSSCIGIAIAGNLFAIQVDPFWQPDKFIPTFGMLIGNSMSAVAVAVNFCLKELSENSANIEVYLSMGASRLEATNLLLKQSIKLALLPTINSMSIIGLISIPGMMTGQILGGSSVSDAVKYQQIIMFMITSSCTLSVLFSTLVSCYLFII